MNTPAFAQLSAANDSQMINETNWHQYYSTMQAECYDDELLDVALNRRRARAMLARQVHHRAGYWLLSLSLCTVAALIWWLG